VADTDIEFSKLLKNKMVQQLRFIIGSVYYFDCQKEKKKRLFRARIVAIETSSIR